MPAPSVTSASAPRFASLSRCTGMPSRAPSSSAGRTPGPAGQDLAGVHRARGAVDRARQPDAGAEDARAVDLGRGEHRVGELDRDVERALGGGVDVELAHALGEDRAREVGDRDVHVLVAEVDAEHEARGAVDREQRRRPALLRRRAASGSRSTSRPPACRSATSVETVERESPVRRASSARLALPRRRSASMSWRRLRSRSDSSEPDPDGCMGATLPRCRPFVKSSGENESQKAP